MRLAGPNASPLPPCDDLAQAIANAARLLGHRPAITVVRADRRDEQGFVSLAQWTAKGAHLLQIECGLGPGDRLHLVSPPGWIAAAVCCAAWWAGVAVTDRADAAVTVAHEATTSAATGDAYILGDAFDGSPIGASAAEPWAVAVQSFPDRPPPAAATAGTTAFDIDREALSHAATVDAALGAPTALAADAPMRLWLLALARVFVTGEPLTIR